MTSQSFDPKKHWEKIYDTKGPQDVSWFQAMPKVSLDLFEQYKVPTDARIIDVGGGDSLLVDHLLDRGFGDVTVLDISGSALHKAQERLGPRAAQVQWIEADATQFDAPQPFDVWHDRAVFAYFAAASPEPPATFADAKFRPGADDYSCIFDPVGGRATVSVNVTMKIGFGPFSIKKNIPLAEAFRLQFRVESFNLTNTPIFGLPNTTVGNPGFGVIGSQANQPRNLQLGLKVIW